MTQMWYLIVSITDLYTLIFFYFDFFSLQLIVQQKMVGYAVETGHCHSVTFIPMLKKNVQTCVEYVQVHQ